MAYWTNPDFTPEAMQCSSSTTYTVGIAVGFSTSGAGVTASNPISYTYSCPYYTISVYGIPSTSTPLGSAAFNDTWVFTPQNAQYVEDQQSYGVESDGPTYMGPAYVPQSSVYTIPAGASAVVYKPNSCGLLNLSTLYEYIAYDINWDVWVTASGSKALMSSSSAGYVILLPGANPNWGSSTASTTRHRANSN